MENAWIGMTMGLLILLASMASVELGISVALIEIGFGIVAGNFLGLHSTSWIDFLASFASIVLTFLAGAELDPEVFQLKWKEATVVGLAGFVAPFLGASAAARWLLGWEPGPSWLAGVAMSTTSVAVVYAVMVETGFNRTEIGKLILAACFINDIGTVLALGLVFANYNGYLALFVIVTLAVVAVLPWTVPRLFKLIGKRVSEPEIKFIFLVLFGLGGLSNLARSEAVLPAYLVGMVLAPFFIRNKELQHRMRAIAFAFLTPFYFIKAGSLIDAKVVVGSAALIAAFLGVKMATKFAGILPLTHYFKFKKPAGMYTTMMMSTGLTFGSISALFGFTNHIIDQGQYTILLTAVIGSAVVPTVIAQTWFQPKFEPLEEDA